MAPNFTDSTQYREETFSVLSIPLQILQSASSIAPNDTNAAVNTLPGHLQALAAEIQLKIVDECGLLSRANLARTSKHFACLITTNKSLDFKAYRNIQLQPSRRDLHVDANFLCADLNFLIYSHVSVKNAEEFDETGRVIMQVPISDGQVICTHCGWRDVSPDHYPGPGRWAAYSMNDHLKFWDRHMATELSRLGVVYSPGVHILSQSARGAIKAETRRIEEAGEPHLAQLKAKFKEKLRGRWNKFQVNQMLLSWERQEKAGLELWTVFRRMPSRWGF